HAIWARRWCVVARREHLLSHGTWHQGRSRVDQLLPPLSGGRGIRWLQAVRLGSREPQDDAEPLPADQESARELQSERAGILLTVVAGPLLMEQSRGRSTFGPA